MIINHFPVEFNSLLWKDPPFFMGKSTISMATFQWNSTQKIQAGSGTASQSVQQHLLTLTATSFQLLFDGTPNCWEEDQTWKLGRNLNSRGSKTWQLKIPRLKIKYKIKWHTHVKTVHVNTVVFMNQMPFKWPVPLSKLCMSTRLFS